MRDLALLTLGMALPWWFGVLLLDRASAWRSGRDAPPRAWIVGCGWFAGIFIVTLIMRAVSALGVPLSLPAIGAPLLIATLALAALAWRSRAPSNRSFNGYLRVLAGAELDGWQKLAWRLMLAWLALRFALLLGEVWWRPLYPWDAWTQWGTKARVWFELKALVPFVPVSEWLHESVPGAYYDAAPHYPATVPLFQVWSALLIGRWDDALVNLPWWVSGAAFAIAFHGALLDLRFRPLVALLGTTLVMSLPILNAHIALAGYAELPMAAYLTLGTLAALRFLRTRSPADAMLAALLLVACVTVKNPGKVWLIVLVPGLAVAASARWGRKFAAAAFVGAAVTIVVLTQSEVRILNYHLSPEYAMPWRALFDAYFAFGNWHLLWYCAVAALVLGWRQLFAREVAPLTCIVAAGLMFLFVGFAFTNAGAWVEDQSTVNRATLHLAPLVAVWILVTLRAWNAARGESASRKADPAELRAT